MLPINLLYILACHPTNINIVCVKFTLLRRENQYDVLQYWLWWSSLNIADLCKLFYISYSCTRASYLVITHPSTLCLLDTWVEHISDMCVLWPLRNRKAVLKPFVVFIVVDIFPSFYCVRLFVEVLCTWLGIYFISI